MSGVMEREVLLQQKPGGSGYATLGGAVEICFSTRGKLSKVFCEKNIMLFIKAALPINNGYGDQVMVPEEAELGNLMYLVERGGIPVSAEESMELKRYRKARNELAHMNLLSNEELCVILKAGKHKTASD